MNAVKTDVEALVKKELEAANERFPLFNSAHEGYAVLLEEAEELEAESASVKYDMLCLWTAVKCNSSEAAEATISHTYERAVNAAIEAIQVAAMCEKYEMSIIEDGKPKADNEPQNDDKVYCKDCTYCIHNKDKTDYVCCRNGIITCGAYYWCYRGKKRDDKNA